MNFWAVLGIEPTGDEKEIKQAYLCKLPFFNPEEDQEGFLRLRKAYEEALNCLAAEAEPEDNTPSGLVLRDFMDIYRDFSRRIKSDEWQAVLDREICQRIDTQQEMGEKLLRFFMQEFHLPHKTWKILADFFDWRECQEALKQKFPANYIDYVINQSTYEDPLRYELFTAEAGLDYDLFISNYLKLLELMSSGRLESAEALFLETDMLGISHLDYSLLKLRYYLLSGQMELAGALAGSLSEAYPEDIPVLLGVAQCWLHLKVTEEARLLFEKVLREIPEHYNARVGLANCAYYTEEYAAAKEAYRELLLEYPYDIYVGSAFYNCNENLIPGYEEKLAADPQDQDNVYKLASCYHNCRRFSDAQNLLAPLTPDPEFAAKHHNIYAYALMVAGEKEEALKHYLLWEPLEKDSLRVVRELPAELLALGQDEIALEKSELYMRDYPREAVLYDVKAGVLRKRGQRAEALEIIEEGLECNRNYLNLHMQKAEILYEQRNFGGSLDSAAAALQIYPYVFSMLLLQIKIYYDAGDYEQVLRVCEQTVKYNMEEKEADLYRALANINLNQELPAALDVLDRFVETDPANGLAVYALKEYYMENKDYGKALSYLERAIAANPEQPFFRLDRVRIYRRLKELETARKDLAWIEENRPLETTDFYNEKGFLYEDLGDVGEARRCYEKVIELNEYDAFAYGNLAGLFSQAEEYEKAAEYYTKQLAIREHPHYYISRGLAYSHLGRTEEEKADYLKTLELDPDYAYAYNNLGVVYYEEDNYSEAVTYLEQALQREQGIFSVHQYLAKAHIALGQPEKALTALDAGIGYFQSTDQKNACRLLWREKLDLLRDLGRYEEILALRNSPELPETVHTYRTFGYAAYEMSQDKLALQYLEKALALDKTDAETHRYLGHFYHHALKQTYKALKFYEKAVSLDPDDYQNHLSLARLYEMKEDGRNAAKHFAKALEFLEEYLRKLSEKNASAGGSPCDFYNMGDCFRGLGKYKKAVEFYKQALEEAKHTPHCVVRYCYESLFGLAVLSETLGEEEHALELLDQAIAVMPDREYVEKKKALLAKQAGKGRKKGVLGFLFGK